MSSYTVSIVGVLVGVGGTKVAVGVLVDVAVGVGLLVTV